MSHVDTIAAIATPPGRSAVSVIRVSGPGTRDVIRRIAGEAELEARRATLRTIRDPATGRPVDRALLTFFPKPDSFTGDDVVELSGHGGPIVPLLLLDTVVAAGARQALPGEFTRRAYLAGKLDLVQAEATLDLIEATSSRMRDAALFALERGLSERIETLRGQCLELQAMLAYDIDFPEEDDGPLDRSALASTARGVAGRIDGMVATGDSGMLIREGALTVIAGRPNVGKSTLFNALLGVERAIVTSEPGTTRDAIEAPWTADGYPFRLVDTAGVRTGAGLAETKGIEFAHSYLDRADIVLLCAEAGRPLDADEVDLLERVGDDEERRTIVVRTKADAAESVVVHGEGPEQFPVSSTTGHGLAELITAITTTVYGNHNDQTIVLRHRQLRALKAASGAMTDFMAAWDGGAPSEIAATHLQDAVVALEDVLGIVTTEDVLDRLFAEFCVGK